MNWVFSDVSDNLTILNHSLLSISMNGSLQIRKVDFFDKYICLSRVKDNKSNTW